MQETWEEGTHAQGRADLCLPCTLVILVFSALTVTLGLWSYNQILSLQRSPRKLGPPLLITVPKPCSPHSTLQTRSFRISGWEGPGIHVFLRLPVTLCAPRVPRSPL